MPNAITTMPTIVTATRNIITPMRNIITAIMHRANITSTASYIVSANASLTQGLGFVTSLALLARFGEPSLTCDLYLPIPLVTPLALLARFGDRAAVASAFLR